MDILIPYDTISVEVRKGNARISLETSILIIDPSTFLGSTWGMIWGGVLYLLRQCLDPQGVIICEYIVYNRLNSIKYYF